MPAGTAFVVHDNFVDGALRYEIGAFQNGWGLWDFGGHAEVDHASMACGVGNELRLNNAVAIFKSSSGAMNKVSFRYGDWGGNINVEINKDFRNVADMAMLNGLTIGGVTLHVVAGGGHGCGEVQLHGVVKRMAIGGQEFAIDCLRGRLLRPKSPTAAERRGMVQDLLRTLENVGTESPLSDFDGNRVVDERDVLLAIEQFSDAASVEIEPNPSPAPQSESDAPGRIGIAPLPSPGPQTPDAAQSRIGAIPLPSPAPGRPEDARERIGIFPLPTP